jgi:hypothetical protein
MSKHTWLVTPSLIKAERIIEAVAEWVENRPKEKYRNEETALSWCGYYVEVCAQKSHRGVKSIFQQTLRRGFKYHLNQSNYVLTVKLHFSFFSNPVLWDYIDGDLTDALNLEFATPPNVVGDYLAEHFSEFEQLGYAFG